MIIYPIKAFTDNYIWALIDKNAGHFDCFDPGDADVVLEFATHHNLKLRSILLTHHHFDHIGGVSKLQATYPNCTVYGPKDERIPMITHSLSSGDQISMGGFCFKILFCPGHTSSHISYYEETKHWLFCGDTLFSAGCGRVFDGTIEQLHDSLQTFKTLPEATWVFCTHEYTRQNLEFALYVEPDNEQIINYRRHLTESVDKCSLPSTMAQERLINPFLRTDIAQVQQFASTYGALSTNSLDVFRVLREQKNLF